jgi:hypothetical protein
MVGLILCWLVGFGERKARKEGEAVEVGKVESAGMWAVEIEASNMDKSSRASH